MGTALSFKCESAGTFVDDVDCSKFHRCLARGSGFTDYPGQASREGGRTFREANGFSHV